MVVQVALVEVVEEREQAGLVEEQLGRVEVQCRRRCLMLEGEWWGVQGWRWWLVLLLCLFCEIEDVGYDL